MRAEGSCFCGPVIDLINKNRIKMVLVAIIKRLQRNKNKLAQTLFSYGNDDRKKGKQDFYQCYNYRVNPHRDKKKKEGREGKQRRVA